VFGLSDKHFFGVAVILYGVSMIYSFFLWRRGFREDNRTNYAILLAAFLFHTGAMVKRGFSLAHCPVTNMYEAMVFVAWTIVTVYLCIGIFSRLRFLGAFASPVLFGMGVFALIALLSPEGEKPGFQGGFASLHAALILLSYGAFGLSSIAGVMYITQEHDLKFRKTRAVFSLMPPMERLEKVIGRLLTIGFILLTVGLLQSPLLLKQRYNVYFSNDPKLIWSLIVWAAYLGLIVLHSRFAQTGKRFAWGAVGTFVFVLLTFWGVNLLSPAHNP
jgi:ABC-type transport system involved in cytochrome c biogenesis permease subunit